jgi:creatinine amidohydrolase
MKVYRLETLSLKDYQDISRDKTIIFICVDPLEEHGPHLPLATDPVQSRALAEMIAEEFTKQNPEWNVLLYPPLYFGSDTMIDQGSFEFKQKIVRTLVLTILKKLAKDKFKFSVLITAHGGLRHLIALEEAANRAWWKYKIKTISASSRILPKILSPKFTETLEIELIKFGSQLHELERQALNQNDFHGGMLETSMMLKIASNLVSQDFYKLKPAILKNKFKFNRKIGKKLGDGLGYIGFPHLARPEIAQGIINFIVHDTVSNLNKLIQGVDIRKLYRSPFYYIPFLRTDFLMLVIIFIYMILFSTAFILFISILGVKL